MAASTNEVGTALFKDYRSKVVVGSLPPDFLSVPRTGSNSQEEIDHALAARLQAGNRTRPVVGRLEVTVVRCTLNKNYGMAGMARMDPYARIHFGQQVFETQTDHNGGKNPIWNKTFYIYQLPESFTTFHMEIYDERTFTDDERIAWVTVTLPENLRQGEVSDRWYELSGRMGEQREGSIYVIMAYTVGPAANPVMVYGGGRRQGHPVYSVPGAVVQQVAQPAPPPISEDDVKQVSDLFPDTEEDVVRSVLEASGGNKERTVEALLSMQSE